MVFYESVLQVPAIASFGLKKKYKQNSKSGGKDFIQNYQGCKLKDI